MIAPATMLEATIERRATSGGVGLVVPIAGVTAAVVAVLLARRGMTPEALRLALRLTARISGSLFTLVFLASPVARIGGGSLGRWLVLHRRQLGLSFGAVHLIHGCLVVSLAWRIHGGDVAALSSLPAVVGGVLVYAVIVAMMATSSDAAVRRLGATRWKRLHRFGLWVVFAVFFADYTAMALDAGGLAWIPAAGLSAALGLRLGVWLRGRRR